ncbi:MAG: hypothetical protein JW797_06310 [Bradymonadales bacterium]|nr:hypothetical protein [Bradymonadales bacterium]
MAMRHQHGLHASVLVVLALLVMGCAGVQTAPARRNPYRSELLNADFTSAYPRATDVDPFGLAMASSRQDGDSSQARLATADTGPSLSTGGDRRDPAAVRGANAPSIPPDTLYDPMVAAQYVTEVYRANDTPTHEGNPSNRVDIVDIYRHAQRNGTIYHSTRPAVGDLVFFHNTYDRNGDGRANDWYTHIGVVESVDEQGNISVLSYLDRRVSRTYLNLEQPAATQNDGGRAINTAMRLPSPSDPPYTQYLASELFAGFGSLLGERNEFLVIDNWRPGMNVARAD